VDMRRKESKMKRRFLAWLLCTVMLFNNALPVFATETTEHVHSEDCSEDCTLGTPVTTDTGDEDDATDPENQPEQTTNQPENGNNGQHNGQNNGNGQGNNDNGNHNGQNKCETCKKNPCECCTECKQYGSHASDCIHYVDPDACETCKKNPCECCLEGCAGDSHAEGCPNAPKVETTTCPNCEATYNVGDEHSCNCTICAEPWTEEHTCPTCEFCGINMFGENIVHAENCHTFCKCNAEFGTAHADGYNCPLFTDHPFCDCEYFRNEEGTLTHADGCVKNYTCTICGNKGHKEENCPECPLCINVEGATEHKGEKCKLYCDTCSAIVPDGAAHIDTCYKDKICKVCNEYGKHLTANCPECPACKEVSDNHDFNKNCKFANPTNAEVYQLVDGIHTKVEDTRINMVANNKATYYVLNGSAQILHFEHKTPLDWGIIGSNFALTESKYAILSKSGAIVGDTKADITLASDVPVGTKLTLSTGDVEVYIEVIDELIIKKPTTEVEFDNKTFIGEVPLTVSEVSETVIEEINEHVAPVNDGWERETFAYDIHGDMGEATEPVEVVINGMLTEEDMNNYDFFKVRVYHQLDDGSIEGLDATVDIYGNVTFKTSSFSTFCFTVDCHNLTGVNDGNTDDKYDGTSYSIKIATATAVKDMLISLGAPAEGTLTSVSVDTSNVKIPETLTEEEKEPYISNLVVLGGKTVDVRTIKISEDFDGYIVLNAVYGDKEYTINLATPSIYYYLDGTTDGNEDGKDDWCMDTTVIDNPGFDSGETSYTTNAVAIGVNDVTGGAVIYARPGMVLTFTSGWKWPNLAGTGWDGHDPNDPAHSFIDYGIWERVSAGDNNYVKIDSTIDEVKTLNIKCYATDTTDTTRLQYDSEITIHIIPDYDPTLLEKTEHADKIKTLPVTLYNYDGVAWRNYYTAQDPNTKFFEFGSASNGVESALTFKSGVNNSGLTMGILENKFDVTAGETPKLKYGQAVDLFSNEEVGGKKVYDNVGFQFVYDEDTGYYTYASQANAAQFFEEDKMIKLYRENLAATDGGASVGCNHAGFYPFVDLSKAFLGVYGSRGIELGSTGIAGDTRNTLPSSNLLDDAKWEEALGAGYAQYSGYLVRDLVNTTDTTGLSNVDMHFGLKIERPFYLNEDKTDESGNDMIFQFTGDDDMWVFIDGKLVLDLGGRHGPMSGEINITKGTVESWDYASGRDGNTTYYKVTGVDTSEEYVTGDDTITNPDNPVYKNYTSKFNIEGDQMHTISIFYLERDSGHSNCYMRFNIPVLPANAVMVSKELVSDSGEALSVTPDEEYEFMVYSRNLKNEATDDNEYTAMKNTSYTVSGETGIKNTGSDGKIKLKAGQTATIEGIERFTEVVALELKPGETYKYTEAKVSVNDDPPVSYTPVEDNNITYVEELVREMHFDTITYDFTNYMKTQTLTIEKEMVGGANGIVAEDANRKFDFNLNFTKPILENPNHSFQLSVGENYSLPRVPVNMTYSVSENAPNNLIEGTSFDKPTFALTTSTCINENEGSVVVNEFDAANNFKVNDGAENVITVTNKQRFTITITKNTDVNAPDQSFIFKIQGTDEHNSNITNEVVIPYSAFNDGNTATVTIAGLPVGNYTVSEDTEWSWRFTEDIDDAQNIFDESRDIDVAPDDTTAVFNNRRTEIYWMDGEAWCKNLFNKPVGEGANPLGDYILTKKEQDPVTGN